MKLLENFVSINTVPTLGAPGLCFFICICSLLSYAMYLRRVINLFWKFPEGVVTHMALNTGVLDD